MNTVTVMEPQNRQQAAVHNPMGMIGLAVEQGASIETLEKLMALQERWEANQARRAFDEAMAAAKAEIPTIAKNRAVGYDNKDGKGSTNYRHEDLAEIARTVDPILGKHGLSYRFRTTSEVNQPITVTCIVSHRDGHSEENTLMAGKDESGKKNSIQAIGSTLTYLQRYTLKAALGLAASNDDDGAKAEEVESPPIGPDEMAALRQLIDEVNLSIDKFCASFNIEALVDITVDMLPSITRRLLERKAKLDRAREGAAREASE